MADQNVNFDGNLAANLELSDDDGMVDFIAGGPGGEILHTRRNVVQDPIKIVIGGYHAKTGELGIFHWTSKSSRSYIRRVILNTLRQARLYGVPLDVESIFVARVQATDKVPEEAQTFTRGTKSFLSRAIPRLTIAQRIELIREQLADEQLDDEKRAKLEERLEKFQSQSERTTRVRAEDELNPEDKETLSGLMAEVIDVVATRPNLGFRVKKLAVAVAKEKGLPANSVFRTEHGAWGIESKKEETQVEAEADTEEK